MAYYVAQESFPAFIRRWRISANPQPGLGITAYPTGGVKPAPKTKEPAPAPAPAPAPIETSSRRDTDDSRDAPSDDPRVDLLPYTTT